MDERVLMLIKPDGVKRGIVGRIIQRFEDRGLRLVGMKMIQPTDEQLKKHYPDEMGKNIGEKAREKFLEEGKNFKWKPKEYGEVILTQLRGYFKKSPIVATVFHGPHACVTGKKIAGPTEPREAAPGTIRGDFHTESYEYANLKNRAVRNVVHISDEDKAEEEIKIWFTDEELCQNYERSDEEITRAPSKDGPTLEDIQKN